MSSAHIGPAALALGASTRVRFLPAAEYSGTPPPLQLRAIDDSYGGSFSDTSAGESRVNADTTTRGGSTPIAAQKSTLSTSVTADNDAPVLGNNFLSISEGATVVLTGADLSASDVDAAAAGLIFNVSALTGGRFERVAAPGVAIASFVQSEVTSGAIQFVHDGGEAAPSYAVSVSDGVDNTTPVPANVAFANQNDPPGLANLAGDVLGFPQGAVPLVIDQGAAALVTDTDSPSFAGGRVQVGITAGGAPAEDVLSIRDQGVGLGEIGFSGGVVTYEGATIGTATGGTAGVDLLVSLNASATPSAVEALLRNITYQNTDAAGPTLGSRSVEFLVEDDASGVSTALTGITVFSTNAVPSIAGTIAGQTVDDDALIALFASTTVDDVDTPAQILSVDVQLDDAAKGALGNLGGFADMGGGLYRFTGTAANATTAIQGLTFDPTGNRVAVGVTETSAFTITVNDGIAAPSVDSTTTVIATSVNDAPTLVGTVASQTLDDDATLDPFSAVTIGDADTPAQILSVDVQLDDAAKGTLTNLGSFSDLGGGLVRFNGTAAAATTAIRGLTFSPTENRVAVGSTETTTFTVTVDDGAGAPAVDITTTAIATSVNDAPLVAGTLSGQTLDDDTTVAPFSGVTLSDVDPGQLLTVDVQLDDAAKGTLGNLGGFGDLGGGLYRFSGTAAAATTAIQGLVFDPTDNRVAVGSTETTTFTVTVDDAVSAPVVESTTTVIATSVNDAPTVLGTVAGQGVDDDATLAAFSGVTISEVDPSQSVTVDVQLDDAAKGTLGNLGGFLDMGGGLYRFTGTAAAVTRDIQGLVFDPTDNRVAVGSTETTTFTVTLDDGVATPVVDSTVTVIATSVNDAPTVVGTVAGQSVDDDATLAAFSGVTISEVDPSHSLTVDVQLDDAAKGALTSLGGFSDMGGGLYRFTGTAAAATTAIQGLVFDPTDNRVAAGSTETTTFTITVNDALSAPVADNTTTVIATSVNNAPVLAAAAPSLPTLTEDDTANPGAPVASISGAAIGDLDAGALSGIAITGLSSGNGTWQYSTNAGVSWSAVGAVSDANARLLRAADRVRFVPDALNADAGSFDFRAWDQTAGSAGSTGDASSPGGASAFSSATDTARIDVTALNDAPATADASLPAVASDDSDPPGETLANLLGGGFSDPDAGAGFAGVAVVGNAADATTEGVWQYSSDGGTSWSAIGPVADGPTALALSASSRVRFVASAGFIGAPPALSVRALDDSYAAAFSSTAGGIEVAVQVDTTTSGGLSSIAGTPSAVSATVGAPLELDPDDLTPSPDPEPDPDPEPEPDPEPDPEPGEEADPMPLGDVTSPPAEDPVAIGPAIPMAGGASPPPPTAVEGTARRDGFDRAASPFQGGIQLSGGSFSFEPFGAPLTALATLISEAPPTDFVRELDLLRDEIEELTQVEARITGSTMAMTTGLSVGYVIWLTRGGLLLASVMSSLPAWRLIDPIPILAQLNLAGEEDDESLEAMVRRSAEANENEARSGASETDDGDTEGVGT